MPLVKKRKPENEAAYQAELQRNRDPLGLRNMNLPSFADDYAHHRQTSYNGLYHSNNHDENFFNAPGHRIRAGSNLEERGITLMPSSDVKDLIKEIMNNGPKSIPAHIKAVVASNKFGYKFVTEINGHLDYRFYCSGKRYNGC